MTIKGDLYRNQKAIQINKKRNPIDFYDVRIGDIFKIDLLAACRNLKESSLKIYLYLLSNQDGYVGGLSSADVCAQTGISESSFRRGIQELIDKKYLINQQEAVYDKQGKSAPLYAFNAWSN